MPEYPNAAYFTRVPDWVCEVLSRSTRKLDLRVKQRVYAREGVGYRWHIDPNARSLEAFVLRGTEWMLIDSVFDDATVSLPPFEAISFYLSDLWPPQALHKAVPELEVEEATSELVQAAK